MTPASSTAATIPLAPATIHEAELAPGVSGVVWWGQEIDQDAAIVRRQAGKDVVVCGDELKANRAVAQKIEAAVGPYLRGVPHTRHAGPMRCRTFSKSIRTTAATLFTRSRTGERGKSHEILHP